MNQKSHDSRLLYRRLHIQLFFCWNIDVTTAHSSVSAVMLTADIVGPSPLTRLFSHALRWGPGSPGQRYSFIGFVQSLKEWGRVVEISFAGLVAGLHLRRRLSMEDINWRKPPEVTSHLSAHVIEGQRWRMLGDICSRSPVVATECSLIFCSLIFNLSKCQWRTDIKVN